MTVRRSSAPKVGRRPAATNPVARLLVDVALPHLDRPFDYAVPEALDETVQPGSRVRVRFAGRLVDAYVLERVAETDHAGTLAFIERAVGAEAVLTAETTALFRAVADRWAGNFVDVVRLGVPARHAQAETRKPDPPGDAAAQDGVDHAATDAGWSRYRAGTSFLAALGEAKPARAVWSVLPGDDWPARLAEAARAVSGAGRGVVLVVPDARDLERLDQALARTLGSGRHMALSADLGPSERYRRWLAVRRGQVLVAAGTRAAAYAPVTDPGLFVIWDDGDDLHAEPRAPYPHVRDVLVLRSSLTGAALLVGAHARTAEAQQLLESGWAHEISAERGVLRAVAPRVRAVGDDSEIARDPAAAAARLPSLAWRTTKAELEAGRPVLVQVPRGGYVPALACARDRTPARCAVCGGPLASRGSGTVAACGWCGRPAGDWTCPTCGGRALRASVIGSRRTADELGRAFPGYPVRTSGGDRVLATLEHEAAVVVATPGAEPVPAQGYGAALLLDGWALLSRPDLRAAEETLRRWANAAALVRPGGPVIVGGTDAGVPAVQALVRWDAAGFAARELAERRELGFPPAARMAALTGPAVAVAELLAGTVLPEDTQLIGPVPVAANNPGSESATGADLQRMLLRTDRRHGAELAHALKIGAAGRSARRSAEAVRIVLDPLDAL